MRKKESIVASIIARLRSDFELLFRAAKTAHEAAVHEENVPDNKYDTLSLEASYVAQGQANRAQEIRRALEAYRTLELQAFGDDSSVRLTALVTLEDGEGEERTVFLGPAAGGMRILAEGREVTIITPESPLGRELLGKSCGDGVSVMVAGVAREYEIVQIR